MSIGDIAELLKLIAKWENPIAIAISVVLVFFLLWRKLTNSEYVTGGKECWAEMMDLYNAAKKELSDTKNQLEESRRIISELEAELIKKQSIKNGGQPE